jgi:hypothetical protein
VILRDNYSQAPGACRLCSLSILPTFDTERDYDSDGFGGVMYICASCAGTMADMLGWAHPDRVLDMTEELNRTAERLDEQETENADLAAKLATMVEAHGIATAATPVKRGPGRPRKDA